jgi:hypothetical protein
MGVTGSLAAKASAADASVAPKPLPPVVHLYGPADLELVKAR